MRQNIARFLMLGLILGAILSSAIPSLADPETNKINTMEITIQSISGSDTYGVAIVLVGGIIKIPPRAPSQMLEQDTADKMTVKYVGINGKN